MEPSDMLFLEFSNVEQRILTENKIDNSLHEDLLKWRDDYRSLHKSTSKELQNSMFLLRRKTFSWTTQAQLCKYFRGDERKVIRWGLDLSGGKTVQIELRDNNNRVVTNEADIRQGINELYNRVNKMGVSEVSIRQEGNSIALDFPGSQSLSASDLVKASSMYFHIVNEKFMVNQTLGRSLSPILSKMFGMKPLSPTEKTSKKSTLIAWRHLYGESSNPDAVQPRSAAAKTLFDNGLRLAHPQEMNAKLQSSMRPSQKFLYRGDDFTDWHGQTHPLLSSSATTPSKEQTSKTSAALTILPKEIT
jgi:SecD/SecF fusion protein